MGSQTPGSARDLRSSGRVRRRRRTAAGIAMAMAVAVSAMTVPAAQAAPEPSKGGGAPIPGRYVVVLDEGQDASTVAARHGARPHFTYKTALDGFAADLSNGQLARLRRDAAVKYVVQDATVSINQRPPSPGVSTSGVRTSTVQSGATWGIDRVDSPTSTDGLYHYTATGAGVTAYVIDTGIYTAHSQFGGRAVAGPAGFDAFGSNGQDCNGHGTHVAGTIGGATYGVAKAVRLVSVRVLDCSGNGSWSGVIAGVDWVAHANAGKSVANMSLGGGHFQPLDDAVTNSINYGVTYAVAAGNDAVDACTVSPAATPRAITVAATDSTDTRAWFSNHGSCVDTFAPGVGITSAWIGSPSAISTISGTSMASPHVAGLAALYVQRNAFASPAHVTDVLLDSAAVGEVTDPAGSPNRLARKWNGSLAGPGSVQFQPDGGFWHQSSPGWIKGWLHSAPGTDYDLELWRWNGSSWVTVKRQATTTSNETLIYNAPLSGFYTFRVSSAAGTGTYDLFVSRPG